MLLFPKSTKSPEVAVDVENLAESITPKGILPALGVFISESYNARI